MFVSSYNTYVNTINTDKTKKQDLKKVDENSNFSSKLNQNTQIVIPKNSIEAPINYISNYKSFANKQKIDQQLAHKENQTKELVSYTKINTIQNAKASYETNAKTYPLLNIPKPTIGQAQKEDEKLPTKLQQKMVNTYIDNDNYYKITA